jgi:hypothetical protein
MKFLYLNFLLYYIPVCSYSSVSRSCFCLCCCCCFIIVYTATVTATYIFVFFIFSFFVSFPFSYFFIFFPSLSFPLLYVYIFTFQCSDSLSCRGTLYGPRFMFFCLYVVQATLWYRRVSCMVPTTSHPQ